MSSNNYIAQFFDPKSVAIVGSFKKGLFGGYIVVKTLLDAGYNGNIYPINPSYNGEVLGIRVYPSVISVQDSIDVAFIMIGSKSVPQVLEECGKKNIRAVVVVADGFAERDEEGMRLQEEIREIAKRENIRIIGPNTAGILNTSNGLNPCPYAAGYSSIKAGPVAICSQTGIINPQAFPYADTRCGFSKICDLGNKCDVDESDILEYLGNDPETRVISMHLESIKNGTRFLSVARKITPSKPVLILKGGRTEEGADAAASHTGSMAVDDEIFHAVCKQAGIIRLEKFNELFELPKIFGYQPLPRGNRVAIVSFSGATGILGLDEGIKYGLSVAPFTSETEKVLKDIFFILGRNPVDVGPLPAYLSSGDFMSNYGEIINAVITDKQVDSLFNVIWVDPTGSSMKDYMKTYKELKKKNCGKPVVTWIYGPRMSMIMEMKCRLEELGFPVYNEIETAVRALGVAYNYALYKGIK